MNVKVLASLLVIGIVGAMLGAGTFAAFSDTETSSANVFAAGTLDLKVNGSDLDGTAVITVENVAPGDSESDSILVTNAGTIEGTLTGVITITSNLDNSCNDAEEADESTCNDDDVGELPAELDIVISDGTNTYTNTLTAISGVSLDFGTLVGGADKIITASYTVDGGVDNSIQSDSVTFDIVLTLDQTIV